jgi:hypothetical protein
MPIAGQPITTAIDANPTGFLGALARIERETKATFGGMASPLRQIEGIAAGVTKQFGTMTSVLTGGIIGTTMLASARAAINFGDEVNKAASRAGMAAGEMARLAVAAKATDVDIGTLSKSFKELQTSISRAGTGSKNDAALFEALGIELNALKAMRPEEQLGLIADRLAQIRDPADRARVGTDLLGKAYLELVPLLERGSAGLREMIEEQRRLGNVLGEEQIKALRDADDAIKRMNSSWQGLSRTLTAAVAPALTAVFDALSRAKAGTEEGLKNALAGTQYQLRELEKRRATIKGPKIDTSELDADIAKARAKIDELMGQLLPGVTPTSQRKGDIDLSKLAPPDKAGKGSGTAGDSVMAALQAQLEARQLIYARENEGREFSKAQELAFWREIVETVEMGTKDRLAVFQRMSRLEVEIARDVARQKIEVDRVRGEAARDLELSEIASAEAAAQREVDAGQRTKASLLSLQREFNEARLVVELEFLERKRALLSADPDADPAALEALEAAKLAVKRKYAELGLQISDKEAKDTGGKIANISQTIGQAFSNFANSFLTNWRGLGNALRSLLGSIGQTVINELVLKPIQARVAAFARERLLALATIATEGAKAGAGAAASQASIPIIGPGLAIAAMGAVLAAVGGLSAKVPSAAGGFDIPKGMNPLTQLHEREMVLPATLADTVRDMAASRGAEGPARASTPVQLRAMNVGRDFLMMNRNELADVLRVLGAEFKIRP